MTLDASLTRRAKKRRKYFGLIDKDGKTCTKGDAGCTFEAGIRPLTRLVKTRYTSRSSFRISLGIECLKPAGETCTRNFAFRADYQSFECKCEENLGDVTEFVANNNNFVSNNLGGLGPTSGLQEMRFKKAAVSRYGKDVDIVVKALDTQDKYHSFSPKDHNIIAGRGFQINLGVVAKQGKPVTTTEFEFSFEDRHGFPVTMDAVDIYLTDLDRDAKVTLREQSCYNLDELDLKGSSIPGFDTNTLKLKPEPVDPGFSGTQLRTTYNKDKNCDGSSKTNLGSVTVEGNQVGFECDNALDTPMQDFKPIKCNDPGCFTDKACQKKRKYFGLIDKDGKTCIKGDAGCPFEAGIHPQT